MSQIKKNHLLTKPNFSKMGEGWKAAVLETPDEYNFLIEAQKSFSNGFPYWINGSTNSTNSTIEYTDYIPNDSGTMICDTYDTFTPFLIFNITDKVLLN